MQMQCYNFYQLEKAYGVTAHKLALTASSNIVVISIQNSGI